MTMMMVRRPDVGTLSVAAAVVLGLQAFRVFTSHIFWVVGETSDRVLLAAIVFGGVILWGLAGPLARFLGIGHGRRISIVLLAGMAVAGQVSGSPTADMWIGGVGTVAFGWVLALWVASVGRAAGQGLALAFTADVAIRGVFRTVDAPFSDSPWAAGIVALLALLALGGGWRAAGRTAEFGGPLRAIPLLGLGSALFVFLAFNGNFGQTAAPSGLDLRAALIWVAAAATAGLAWSSASAKSGRGTEFRTRGGGIAGNGCGGLAGGLGSHQHDSRAGAGGTGAAGGGDGAVSGGLDSRGRRPGRLST